MPNRHAIRALTLGLMTAFAAAHAGTVTVVTSFPKELTRPTRRHSRSANPGIKIEILNKNTTASIAYVRELPAGQRPDVMWAGAPTPSRCWPRQAAAARARGQEEPAPAKIGNYPINDPEGMYLRPGAGRLRPDVEHALHERAQAARAQAVGGPGQA
jgi:phosphoglycerate transport regulatory protein PgtC